MKAQKLRIVLSLVLGLLTAGMMLVLLGPSDREPPAALAQAGSGTIRVATTGTDTPGCGGAATPCRTVQYAVDQAAGGDEIRVATGVYTGVQAHAGITQIVYLNKSLTLCGGYTTTDWTTSNPISYPTTLDAQGQGRVAVISGSVSVTLEGLNVTGGLADGLGGTPDGHDAGAGIYVNGATVTISDMAVYSNSISTQYARGGGLYFASSHATLISNTVTSNRLSSQLASGGGGVACESSQATLMGNIIAHNESSPGDESRGDGGGVYIYDDWTDGTAQAVLNGNLIRNNKAVDGGGVYVDGGVFLTMTNNTVEDNALTNVAWGGAPEGWGGGVYLYASRPATLISNTVAGNHFSGYGGGVLARADGLWIERNVIRDNHSGGMGVGLYAEGENLYIVGNHFLNNHSGSHGVGLYAGGGNLYVVKNRFVGNRGYSDSTYGGGLSLDGSGIVAGNVVTGNSGYNGGGIAAGSDDGHGFTFMNNVIVDNHATNTGAGVYLGASTSGASVLWQTHRGYHNTIAHNTGGVGIYVDSGAYSDRWVTAILTNTILVSNTGGGIAVAWPYAQAALDGTLWYGNGTDTAGSVTTGTVNVYADPAFDTDGYHLTAGSPAVDTGLHMDDFWTDVDGGPRPVAYGFDIGAEERPGTALQLTKEPSNAILGPGDFVTYTIAVTVAGDAANNLRVTDTLPIQQQAAVVTSTHPTCTVTPGWGGGATCSLGTLPAGTTIHLTLTAQVTTTSPPLAGFPFPMANTLAARSDEAGYQIHADTLYQYCLANLNDTVYTEVQDAVDAASEGDLIKVAGLCQGVNTRGSELVDLTKSVTLWGGYSKEDWTTSDPAANPTVLDAQGKGRVLRISGSGIAPIIEGFRMVNGNAAGLGGGPDNWDAGGAVYVSQSAVTLRHNIIQSSRASLGGGVYLTWAGQAKLTSNVIQSNYAGDGGGLALRDSNATLTGNTVQGNTSNSCGGGLYLESSAPTLQRNKILSNTAGYDGGGMYAEKYSDPKLDGNLIQGNAAGGSGGGLYIRFGQVTLHSNMLADNQANTAGSGLYISDASLTLLHTTLARNVEGDGSGAYVASGSALFTNTIVYSHTTGVVNAGGAVAMNRTLWENNGANTSGSVGDSFAISGSVAFAADGYHLTAASDAIDAGVSVGGEADVDGQLRLMGPYPDVGADEHPYQADLGLTKARQGSGSVEAGDPVTFTLTVTNAAASEWQANARVVDTLSPASAVAGLHATAIGGDCQTEETVVTCDLYNVVSDTARTVTLVVTTTGATSGGTTTYPSGGNLNLDIPDNGCGGDNYLEHTINVPNAGAIQDVTIVNLPHTYDGDLNIYLRGPDGTQVELSTGNGESGDNYVNTVFDDEAGTAIADGLPPFTGRFQPEGSLSDFDGKDQQGDWTLRICDTASADVGTLNEWSLTITTLSSDPYSGVLTNTTTITPTDAIDPTPANNIAGPVTVTVVAPVPDVWVNKVASAAYIQPGATLIYTLTWGNSGGFIAANTILTDTLPDGVTYVAASPPPTSGPNPLVWNLGDVAPTSSATYRITTMVKDGLSDGTVLTNTAEIATATAGDPLLNNTAVATTTAYDLGGMDLGVVKTADVSEVTLEDGHNEILYSIYIINTGRVDVGAYMEDAIPAGTEYIALSAWASRGAVDYLDATKKVIWEGDLGVGESVLITFKVKVVSCKGVECGLLENIAKVTVDGISYAWEDQVNVTVRCPDLKVEVTAPTHANFMSPPIYEITVDYANTDFLDDLATTAELVVTVPGGADLNDDYPFILAADPPWTRRINWRQVVWELPLLNPGQGGQIKVAIDENDAFLDDGYLVQAEIHANPPNDECADYLDDNQAEATTYPVTMGFEKKAPSQKIVADPWGGVELLQEYVLRYAYRNADPQRQDVVKREIVDHKPQELKYVTHTSQPPLRYTFVSHTHLRWESDQAFHLGDQGWLRLQGPVDLRELSPGTTITNTGTLSYTLDQGPTFSETAQVLITAPLVPPLITFPGKGEICPDSEVDVRGLTQAGTEVSILVSSLYDDQPIISDTVTADATGRFSAKVVLGSGAYSITAKSRIKNVSGSVWSDPSKAVVVGSTYGQAWDPQRSYWEGTIKDGRQRGRHVRFNGFRDIMGDYSTTGWQLAGIYGFWDTDLYLYGCGCRLPHQTQVFTVTADGVDYAPVGVDGNRFHFQIGSAHNVRVTSKCDGEEHTSSGRVLIDPDGYVFDVTQGGGYDAETGTFNPVQAIKGVTVTCMVSMPLWGGWVPWPAHLYDDQVNPQVTDSAYPDGITTTGYFAFFTPPGHYYLQVEGVPGYQEWHSSVVEVITQIVHVNVPYTPWPNDVDVYTVTVTPHGLDPAIITVPLGSAVAWVSAISNTDTITDLMTWFENPILRPLSALDPLQDTRGWDAGYLEPGQVYRRRFDWPGTYPYTDAAGHSGQIAVTDEPPLRYLYLPLVLKNYTP